MTRTELAGERPEKRTSGLTRAAGLVWAERRGTSIVYTLQTNVLEDLATEILETRRASEAGVRVSRA
jgi:hypothetical protein